MNAPLKFDPGANTVGLDRKLDARLLPSRPDPAIPVDGLTIGLATMTENSPHGGEMHPDGDEVLVLVSGRVRVVFEEPAFADIDLAPGDGLIVPRGAWHRVDILEPSRIFYATPGPNGDYRPLPDAR